MMTFNILTLVKNSLIFGGIVVIIDVIGEILYNPLIDQKQLLDSMKFEFRILRPLLREQK